MDFLYLLFVQTNRSGSGFTLAVCNTVLAHIVPLATRHEIDNICATDLV
jgi:hypothetical protein